MFPPLTTLTHLVVVKNDLVATLFGATPAADPRARYFKLTLARCNFEAEGSAAGGSTACDADVDAMLNILL